MVKHLLYPVKISCFQHSVLVHVPLNASELCWLRPSLLWSDEQTIDMCRFHIWPLQIHWRGSHLAFTIIINEYSNIYKCITCCCRRTESLCSKGRRPFQKWQMTCVLQLIETVDNEASRYISMEHTKMQPWNWLTGTLLGKAICKDSLKSLYSLLL